MLWLKDGLNSEAYVLILHISDKQKWKSGAFRSVTYDFEPRQELQMQTTQERYDKMCTSRGQCDAQPSKIGLHL
jgi:hypothetical protein